MSWVRVSAGTYKGNQAAMQLTFVPMITSPMVSDASPGTNILANAIVGALRKVCVNPDKFYPLHEPYFGGHETRYVTECIETGWVSSVGKFVDRFEEELAAYTGAKHAVAVVNGTAALHIALILAGVETGDEVLMPTLTFIATANAVSYCGAVPHFVDCELSTLGVDPEALEAYLSEKLELREGSAYNRETGRRVRAIVPMHVFGHPVRIEAIQAVATRYKIVLVEDAAESLGSYYLGKHTGLWGSVATLSFNGNKTITTGGGGAILTNDTALAKRAKHLTTTAKQPHPFAFYHDEVGYNYRLPNLNAALGVAQLEQLSGFITAKRALADTYASLFEGMKGVKFFTEPAGAQSNYWLNVLLLDMPNVAIRDAILKASNDAGIMARPVWQLMHTLPMYCSCPRMALTTAIDIEQRLINIPSSPGLVLPPPTRSV
jgi:perosamine synthetase